MKKRRVTLNLDEDVVQALKALEARHGEPSLSAAANLALREAAAAEAHRLALLHWLDQLDAEHGAASAEQAAEVDEFLDGVMRLGMATGPEHGSTSAA